MLRVPVMFSVLNNTGTSFTSSTLIDNGHPSFETPHTGNITADLHQEMVPKHRLDHPVRMRSLHATGNSGMGHANASAVVAAAVVAAVAVVADVAVVVVDVAVVDDVAAVVDVAVDVAVVDVVVVDCS